MTRFAILADDRAELISGGWGSTRISLFRATKVDTYLTQNTQASNLGLGLLGGFGNAQSLQGNSAGIVTFVG